MKSDENDNLTNSPEGGKLPDPEPGMMDVPSPVRKKKRGNGLFSDVKQRHACTLQPPISIFCLVAALFVAISTTPANAQTPQIKPQTEADPTRAFRLSPGAEQVANAIGVTPLLERFEISRGSQTDAASPMNVETVVVRQEITERVLSASLDVDSVTAVIDLEVEQVRSIRSDLESRRDKQQNLINVASLVTGSALGVVGTALQFKPSTANLGNGIGVGGGATSVLLSIIGIHQQRGGRRVVSDPPRMLARFFGRQLDATETIRSDYPDEIWSYLNSAPPSQPAKGTRREQLIAKWRSEGRIEQYSSPKGERRIESASGNISHTRRFNIDELNDRVAMLLDVRARVSLMKRDLSEILRGLSAPKGSP